MVRARARGKSDRAPALMAVILAMTLRYG